MTIRELKDLIADLPDGDRICFAVWFSDGERIYTPHRECGELRQIKAYDTTFHVIGRCDNCQAHRLDKPWQKSGRLMHDNEDSR